MDCLPPKIDLTPDWATVQREWARITERETIAYEAGRQSRDAEVAALRLQRDLLAERIGAGPSRSLEERVHLLEFIVAQAEPALVRRMLDALDVDWMPPERSR